MVERVEKNKKLVERYPFLLPRNQTNGEVPVGYDFSYTELDMMPNGWRIAFGEQMCEEIREELVKYNCLGDYRIAQIKEKYGALRWYDYGAPKKVGLEIIPKYTKISACTCVTCGAKATRVTYGWNNPFCDECVPGGETMTIEEYLGHGG